MDRLNRIQELMMQKGIDGWLLYDFRGLNPFPQQVLGVTNAFLTRRWFAWIPATGEPEALVHVIEKENLPLPYPIHTYDNRSSLEKELSRLLRGVRCVAMEYSPRGNNPYISRVDAGTADLIWGMGVEIVSSGDLLQFLALWTQEQVEAHRRAAYTLGEVKDAALRYIYERIFHKNPPHEVEVREYMRSVLAEKGLVTDQGPTVAFGPSSALPHYQPLPGSDRVLRRGEVILLDVWAKLPGPYPYADITWIAVWDYAEPEVLEAFGAVLEARDKCVDFLQERVAKGLEVRGWEVDAVARDVLESRGFGPYLQHRTGHSLGITHVHGEATHFDGYETLDDRKVLPGLGFTVEPGVYLGRFGIRSEIDVVVHASSVEVTTPIQRQIDLL